MAVVEQLKVAPDQHRRLALFNPATRARLGEIDLGSASDVRAAVERARKAAPAWADLSVGERAACLQRVLRVLVQRKEEVVDTIVAETGKPRTEAIATEVMVACDALQFYAKRARHILADRTPPLHMLKTKKLRIVHRPLGVVGIITPWNFPFLMPLNPCIQALVAGNAVVLKPSEITPFSAMLLGELFESAGLPEGVFNLVLGDGEAGAALVDAGVDKVSFTGSVTTGRRVSEACGRGLVPCTLELGGKDPMIVCEDADLERAARGAVYGAFANAGQVCASTERVYVVDAVADAFTARVVEETARLRQGPEGEFEVGPMIRSEQLAVVESHVSQALAAGARALTGGQRNPTCRDGAFYEPTVLVDVTQDMAVMREETFGPVLPILRVRDVDEALRLANDSVYGLNASIWTKNRQRGVELAQAVEAGCVVVNDCMLTYGVAESPFGGVKQSGLGRVNGELGLKGFCNVQSILVDRLGGRREPLWFPYGARKFKLLSRVIDAVWGGSLGRWLS